MKNLILPLVLLLFGIQGFSQNMTYVVRGKYSRPITKETLVTANSMADLMNGYPSSWINEYLSTEILVNSNGKNVKAAGINESLTEYQKSLLQTAEVGDEIVVDIGYTYPNSITGINDIRKMHFEATVIPETEAEFPGGYEELTQYLEDNKIKSISEKISGQLLPVVIQFTISENGEIADAHVSTSSEVPAIDRLLLKMIRKMPKWKPAENSNGQKIKQAFEFSVGNVGC